MEFFRETGGAAESRLSELVLQMLGGGAGCPIAIAELSSSEVCELFSEIKVNFEIAFLVATRCLLRLLIILFNRDWEPAEVPDDTDPPGTVERRLMLSWPDS
eukprot:scaffold2799_cov159-Ochromonas_danica.AAC.24